MHGKLFATAALAGMFVIGCSEDSDSTAGVKEDADVVAELDTLIVHDAVTVKKHSKDTVVVRDTVNTKDTVKVLDTVVVHDTIPVKKADVALEKGTISGVSQKGPFVKGSNVTVFELDGTNELLQTGRSFNGTISADDGSFKIKNVSLVSSYVRLTVDGFFLDELTGGKTMTAITLRALSDLSDDHMNVNVNLITHLEYDRVAYLLEKNPSMTLVEAKKQAEKEIFAQFFIDGSTFGYAEDLDIFGTSEADAALLAISAMLPMNLNVSSITERLTSLSDDMAEDGKIDDQKTMNTIAVWAMINDVEGMLPKIRKNILSWKISEDVPAFEKYVRTFWQKQLGFGECGSSEFPVGIVVDIPDGELKIVANPSVNKGEDTRYTCVDSSGVGYVWRMADDIEKDTMGLGRSFDDGFMRDGLINKDSLYVFDNGAFRKADDREKFVKNGCTIKNENKTLKFQYSAYLCTNGQWEFDIDNSDKGTVKDAHNTNVYKTVGIGGQVWMAENVNNDFGNDDNWYCLDQSAENCEKYGTLYPLGMAYDGIKFDYDEIMNPSDENLVYCSVYRGRCEMDDEHQGVCPDGFHIPSFEEYETLVNYVDIFNGDESVATSLKSTEGWNNDANGTDRFGFNALPAGWRVHGDETYFTSSGEEARFWLKMWKNIEYFKVDANDTQPAHSSTNMEFYVRCLQNSKN